MRNVKGQFLNTRILHKRTISGSRFLELLKFTMTGMLLIILGFIGIKLNAGTPTNAKIHFWRGETGSVADIKSCGFNSVGVPLETANNTIILNYQDQGVKVIGNLAYSQDLGLLGNLADAISNPSGSIPLTSFLNAFSSFPDLKGVAWDVEIPAFRYLSPSDIASFKYYTKRAGNFVQEQIEFNDPVFDQNAMIRWEETDTSIKNTSSYTGTWYTSAYTSGHSYSGGAAKYCNTSGSKVDITFTGPVIGLISVKSANQGIINVQVDGVSYPNIDLYNATNIYQAFTLIADNLTTGAHTLTLTNSGTQSPLSSGHYFIFDAITTASDDTHGSQKLGYSSDYDKLAQTFTASQSKMSAVAFRIKRISSAANDADIRVNIYAVDDSGKPTGAPINSIAYIVSGCFINDYSSIIKIYLPVTLTVGNTYAVVLDYAGAYTATNYYEVAAAGKDCYSGGFSLQCTSSGTWTTISNDDLQFFVYSPQDNSVIKLRDDWIDFRCWQIAQCAELYRSKLKDAASIGIFTGADILAENNWSDGAPLGYTNGSNYDKAAQTFKPTSSYLYGITVALKKVGSGRPLKGIEVNIQNTTLVDGVYVPNGEILASSTLPEVGVAPEFKKIFVQLECGLDTSKTYAIVFDYDDDGNSSNYSSSNYYRFAVSNQCYADGTFLKGLQTGSWTNYPDGDMGIELQYLDFSSAADVTGENNLNSATFSTNSICGYNSPHDKCVQIFQPYCKYLSGIDIYIKKYGTPPVGINASIQGTSYDAALHAYIPDGNTLAAFYIDETAVQTSYNLISLGLGCQLDQNKKYALVLDYDDQGNSSNYSVANYYHIGATPTGKYYNLGNYVRGLQDGSWGVYNAYNCDIGFLCRYKNFPLLYVYSSFQESLPYNQTIMERYSANWKYLGDHVDVPIGWGPVLTDTTTVDYVFPRALLGGSIYISDPNTVRKTLLQKMIDLNGAGFEYFGFGTTGELGGDVGVAWSEITNIMNNFEDMFLNAQHSYYSTGLVSTNVASMNQDSALSVLIHDNERLVFVFSNTTAADVVLTNTLLPNETLRFLRYDNGVWGKDTTVLTGPTATIHISDIQPDGINIFYISTNEKVDDKLAEINR